MKARRAMSHSAVEQARRLFHRARRLCAAGRARQVLRFRQRRFPGGTAGAGALQVSTQSSSNYDWTFLSLVVDAQHGVRADLFPGGSARKAWTGRSSTSHPRQLTSRGFCGDAATNRAPAVDLGRDVSKPVRRPRDPLRDQHVRQRVRASGCGIHLARRVSFQGRAPTLRSCHLANFAALANHRIGARTQVRFCALRAAAPSLSVRPRRQDPAQRGDLQPVRVPEAAVGGPGQLPRHNWSSRTGRSSRRWMRILASSRTRTNHRDRIRPWPRLGRRISRRRITCALRFASLGAYHLPGAPADLMPN